MMAMGASYIFLLKCNEGFCLWPASLVKAGVKAFSRRSLKKGASAFFDPSTALRRLLWLLCGGSEGRRENDVCTRALAC
jgi:hypothetical protein